jgi:SAM-dependent methyltransferase
VELAPPGGLSPKDDGFAATAQFYSHRPAYPIAAIQWITDQLRLDGRGRMLDVGCGTGHVCLRFADKFSRIVGIDPSRHMLDAAEATALHQGLSGFEFRQMTAEDLPADLGEFRMISFGASFHRTERERTANAAHQMLEPGGGLALLFPSTPWRGDSPWKDELKRVIEEWTGSAVGGPFEPSQNPIRRSTFGDCLERNFLEHHVWTASQLVGYMKSTSLCSPIALGDRSADFVADLTARLSKVQPDGALHDVLETTVVLAIKRA